MDLDTLDWSGEGEFTGKVIEMLKTLDHVAAVRVEDGPASRAEGGYNFISNEVFVTFAARSRVEIRRVLGLIPVPRTVTSPLMTLASLEAALAGIEDVGPADYADDGMLQYLRTVRIVPPYQTRGYKQVELVRIYEAGHGPAEARGQGSGTRDQG